MSGRYSVDADALDELLREFYATMSQRDSEFCVGQHEHDMSQRAYDELVRKLDCRKLG